MAVDKEEAINRLQDEIATIECGIVALSYQRDGLIEQLTDYEMLLEGMLGGDDDA